MKKFLSSVLTFVLIVGTAITFLVGGFLYINKDEYFPKKLSENLPVISKDIEQITQEEFEKLDKGVIYEFSNEEKESFLNYAHVLYEEYKHVGTPQQGGGSNADYVYYSIREEVVRHKNKKPENMLNLDGSLKYPEAFTGFVISNRMQSFDKEVPGRDDSWTSSKTNVNYKANAFLLTEKFYLTYNNGNEKNYKKEKALFSINSNEDWYNEFQKLLNNSINMYPNARNTLPMKMLQNGFFSKENKYTNKIFEILAAGNWDGIDTAGICNSYDVAAYLMNDASGEYFINYLENIPQKYNIIDDIPDENVSYFYPTKVWKIDNNNIIVDICIDNGDMLDPVDVNEIKAKIVQSNTVGKISGFQTDGTISNKEDYVVYARYFFDDLTQGVFPDGGVSIANYSCAEGWSLGRNSGFDLGGYTYVFNEKAKDVLRDYWGTVANKLEKDEIIDTQKILKNVAKKQNIPYKDALNIWATYLVSHISENDSFNRSEFRVENIPAN